MLENLKNWKTTFMGILTAVASILVLFGVITPEQSTEATQHVVSLLDAVSAGIAAIGGIYLIFKSKDG